MSNDWSAFERARSILLVLLALAILVGAYFLVR